MLAMPSPDVEESVVAPDGVRLHVERFVPAAAPGSGGTPVGMLVFVHGFSAHIGNFRHLGRACADAGLATTLFDCRGHGRSQGRRGHVNRFADFVSDLDLVIAGARARHPTWPLGLAAHSHGALICLEYVLETGDRVGRRSDPADLRSLVLAAPFLGLRMKVPLFKRALAKPLGTLWPTLALANGVKGTDVSRTAEAQAGFYADPLVHHVATSRWFNEVRGAQAHALAAAATGRLRIPTVIQVAGQDRLVSKETTFAFAASAGLAVKVSVYDNLFHEMFLEPERDQVVNDLIGWTIGRLTARTGLETMAP
jgi:lysophospholipase